MFNMALPGNPRYQPKMLYDVFGYDNLYKTVAEVEIATMEVLADIGVISSEDILLLTPEVREKLLDITTSGVDDLERRVTKHDIRAWVRIAQGIVGTRLARWVHVPLTSYDALDTARALQFVRAHEIVKSLTNNVIRILAARVLEFSGVNQIGRTHGQHALPITVGFWLATILNRALTNIQSTNTSAAALVGKISGAVGAYNAQVGLGISDRCGPKTFEKRVLEKIGLKPGLISTQILPPEPMADYLFDCIKLSATFGQFGRDCRHLMRSEISEIGEPFAKGQVGSSTMAHKRNPITFESLEGMWLKNKVEFGKVLECMVSEHQRDLVGSSLMRDFPIIVINLVTQLNTLLRESDGKPFIASITVDYEALKQNFRMPGDAILAEPIYIALQMAGYEGDAHELVNHGALPLSKKQHVTSLIEATREVLFKTDPLAEEIWARIPPETLRLLNDPKRYTGSAKKKADEVADAALTYLERK